VRVPTYPHSKVYRLNAWLLVRVGDRSTMSKAQAGTAAPAEEEEWEDYEEEHEEEEEDTTIANSDVVMRYKKAAQWANEVLTEVVAQVKPDASVKAIAAAGDALVAQKVATLFRGVEKGSAMPTCVNVNGIVCHCNGTEGDVTIQLNDVVRIDLGIHIDGYVAMVAHTVHVTANGELNPEAKESAVIAAGNAVLDAAIRQLRPGNSTTEVAKVIEDCATHFGLNPVEGSLSHQLKRYIVDGFKVIPSKASSDHKVHEYEIQENSVWCLDIVLTTGKGSKLKERDMKPCVYKQAIDASYEPKLNAAFEARGEITNRYQYFPFSVASLEAPKAKLGMSELNKHGVTIPFPVLYEKDGEIVAHFKATVLVTPKKIEKVTGIPIQKGAAPLAAYPDELAAKAKLPISLVDKKKK
jgi:curved DNA binding protein